MRPATEGLEHALRIVDVGGLAEGVAVEDDGGVDAEHRPAAGLMRERARLSSGVLADELDGIRVRRVVLDVPRRDDVEGQSELLEDRPPLRARRGEQERRRRGCAHDFRAFQISSAGHCLAQSAVT